MKNILVVGASSGIGKATAENLRSEGYKVWGTFNKTEVLNSETFEDITQMDVTSSFNLRIPEELHGLVYCPGSINLKSFKRITEQTIIEDWQIHVNGAVKVIQQALPNLLKAEHASVVLYSTVAVQTGFNFHASVAMCKGALEGLTRSLAAEYAPKIRFNAIAPSLTNTPLAEKLLNTEAKMESNAERHPLKRIGEAKDIADLTTFLLSDKSSWMTGQILHLDGGIGNIK